MNRWLIAVALASSLAVPASAQQKPSQPPPAQKAKKVWTNDDLVALREKVYFSSFSTTESSPASSTGGAATGAEAEQAQEPKKPDQVQETPEERVQKRLAALREELKSVEDELRSLRGATSSGKTTGQGIDFRNVDAGLNTEARIAQFEARRKSLLQQIEAIEDQARRDGIAPGALRP